MNMRKSFLGVLLAGVFTLSFCQCNENAATSTASGSQDGVATGIKIAYVEIDTLLSKYQFYQDVMEELLRKEENSRLLLSEKANDFQSDVETFQKKLQNNVFSSRERAEQEENRLAKKQQDLQELQDRLSRELEIENANNTMKVSDSIQSFLKDYNKKKGYSIILSKIGDNILLIDPAMNITEEVLEGLNARYQAQ